MTENPDIAFVSDNPDNVIDLHARVVAENAKLIERLGALGRAPTHSLLHQAALETLLDALFDSTDELREFQCMVDINLNRKLREAVEKCGAEFVLPDGGSPA